MVGYGSLLSFFVFMLKFKSLNVTANVSFYLIAILAQRVESHSLHGKECPVECAHCRSPSQKNIMYFSRTVRKPLQRNIRQNKS